MERLISVLEGEAKRSAESTGGNGIFYGTALKSLTRDFGNPILALHLKIKALLGQPQLKSNDKTGLRHSPTNQNHKYLADVSGIPKSNSVV